MTPGRETTIIWILCGFIWLLVLTLGHPDILDKIIELLDALVKYFGGNCNA